MPMDAWFPRFSVSGRLACGSTTIRVEGAVVGPGTTPVWLDETTVLYTRQPDGACLAWPGDRVIHPQGFNTLTACAGRWAGWRAAEDVLVRSWADALPGARMPQLGRASFACVVPAGNAWRLLRDGHTLHQAALRDLRMSPEGALCWSQHVGGVWEAWGARPGQSPERLHVASGQELWPVPLDSPEGPWVLSHTDTALLLRPWASDHGYVVHVGVTDFPDAIWTVEGWQVAWSERGELRTRLLPHDTPRTLLRGPAPVPIPEPPPVTPEPDPVSYTSIAPNMFHVVQAVHLEQPGLIHRPHGFTREVARRLHAIDARWGDNGKRGNPQDLSEDCVAFKAPGSPAGGVEIYDVIARANTVDAAPAWIDQTWATVANGTIGVWVQPQAAAPGPVPPPVVTPPPPPVPGGCALTVDQVREVVHEVVGQIQLDLARRAEALLAALVEAQARREALAQHLERVMLEPRPVTMSGRLSVTSPTTWRGLVGEGPR